MLWETVFGVRSLHNIDLLEIVEEQELEHGEELAASVRFVLPDTIYNTRRVWENENYNKDIFDFAGVKDMSKHCSEMLRPGAHAHIFCRTLQFGPW